MAAPAGQSREVGRPVPRPSGTAVSFALLIALVALAGAVVGNWLWLSFGRGDGLDLLVPVVWLALPPVAVLAVTALLAALEPHLVVRRRRLVPVPPDLPGATRFGALAAGLRRPPRLMYHPDDAGTSARSVGRPGRHLVVVSPAILGMARRRPATFDVILRHELAHVRSGDVALATFAIRTWHVTLVVLAMPLVTRLWDRDLSMVPSYVARAALLALVVYAVRAQLLRLREHHADIAATPLPEDAARFASALAALGAPPARRRPAWLALHPAPAVRAGVVDYPGLIARPQPGTFLAAGFAAGAAAPVVADILHAAGVNPVSANQFPAAILLGLAGALATAEVLRAGPRGARAFVVPALALVGGAAAGAAGSLGSTALESWLHVVATTAALAALPVAALLLAGASAAAQRGRPSGWALAAAPLIGGLAAGLTVAVWEPWGAAAGMGVVIPAVQRALESGDVLLAAAAVTALCAVLLVPRRGWPALLVTAAAAAGASGAGQLALLAGAGGLGDLNVASAFPDAAFALTLVVAAAAAVLATVRGGAAAGLVAGGLVALAGAAVLVALDMIAGHTPDGSGASVALGRWPMLAIVLGVPVTALAGLVRPGPPGEPVAADVRPAAGARRRRWPLATAGLAAAVLCGGAFVWGGPWVVAESTRLGDTRTLYLQVDLPYLAEAWQYARDDAQFAMGMADPAALLEASTLPAFDRALDYAQQIGGDVAAADDALLVEVHDALVDGMTADRAHWAAVAAAAAGRGTWEEAESLAAEVEAGVERFNAAWDAVAAPSD